MAKNRNDEKDEGGSFWSVSIFLVLFSSDTVRLQLILNGIRHTGHEARNGNGRYNSAT